MAELDLVEDWFSELRKALDLSDLAPVDVAALLAVVREVAHGVVRPAAPVAMFAAGYAAARAGGSSDQVDTILAQISALVGEFSAARGLGSGGKDA